MHKVAGRRLESNLVGDSSTTAGWNSLVEAQITAYRRISTKRYPQMFPQDNVAGLAVFVCVRIESVNDSKLLLLELHEKYRIKRRSIHSASAPMTCTAKEISESIIHIR